VLDEKKRERETERKGETEKRGQNRTEFGFRHPYLYD